MQAGPRTPNGLIPKAVWKWDASARQYAGPEGSNGDHFRVLKADEIWEGSQTARKPRDLTFPNDTEAALATSTGPSELGIAPTPNTPREPYHYQSLKNASDAEVFPFMGKGKRESDQNSHHMRHNQLPKDFWTSEPKAAALAFIELNRTEATREAFQLAIDDRDGEAPPSECVISFSHCSSGHSVAVNQLFFLRADPRESYLVEARTPRGEREIFNSNTIHPAVNLRLCKISYEDARHVMQVIWWLNHARCQRIGRGEDAAWGVSNVDGGGKLTFRTGGKVLIEHADTLPAMFLSEQLSRGYTRETFLNLSDFLFGVALPERLDHEWTQFDLQHARGDFPRPAFATGHTESEKERLQSLGIKLLDLFDPDQDRISFGIVAEAAKVIGMFGVQSEVTHLRKIDATMPPPETSLRTRVEIYADLEKLPNPLFLGNDEEAFRARKRRAPLEAELAEVVHGRGLNHPEHVHDAIALALREIAAFNDLDALHAWATSNSDGKWWALHRLELLAPSRHADALESLMRKTNDGWAREYFEELKPNPSRAG